MGYLLNSGEVGNIGLEHLKQIRQKTISKWDQLGFLKGLKGHVKENIAQLYENQASHLLNESTTAADASGSFETVVFPIVRRVFSKLLANDIVSVQAMNMPIGKLFFFVPVTSDKIESTNWQNVPTSDTADGATAKNPIISGQVPECVTGFNCSVATFSTCAKSLYDRFYNDGLFDGSKGTATIQIATGTPVVWTACTSGNEFTPGTSATAFDSSVRKQIVKVTGFNPLQAGRMGNASPGSDSPNGNEMDSEEFLASLTVVSASAIYDNAGKLIVNSGDEVPFRVVTQKYGQGIVNYASICDATGVLYIEVDLTHPACVDCGTNTIDGYTGAASGWTASTASFVIGWRQYSSLELSTEMGEVSFRLDEVVVSVTERKLRASWSPELAQDVSAFHNIDAEAELTALLSEQVAAEIDREILRDLRKGAAWQLRWDYNGWKRVSTAATPYTQKEWNQTLITKINQVSAQIHKSTLRGGANFIVVSSEVSAIFDDLEYFHVSNANPEQDQYNMGIERIGSLGGRYTVYRDPYAPANSIVIGHKGKSLLDTGYVYAPYVPLQLTPTMYNPFNFAPVKGIMTRYAKKMVNNRFYGAIRVDGIQTFDTRELR
jgi:hypothetical protein